MRGRLRSFPLEIKVVIPEMLCKTRIVLSDEHSAMSVPNRATADETRSLSRYTRSVSAGYFTTPAAGIGGSFFVLTLQRLEARWILNSSGVQ